MAPKNEIKKIKNSRIKLMSKLYCQKINFCEIELINALITGNATIMINDAIVNCLMSSTMVLGSFFKNVHKTVINNPIDKINIKE